LSSGKRHDLIKRLVRAIIINPQYKRGTEMDREYNIKHKLPRTERSAWNP